MHYVYFLKSVKKNETYVGSTNDLRKRVEEHNSGRSQSTRRYMPWKLLYYEAYNTEHMARVRESRLKHNGNALRELKKRIGLDSPHKSGAGFTMIEIMVTIAIFSLLVGLGLFMSMEAYRGATHRSERDVIVSLLEKARSRAMANIDQSAWSVCYEDPNYIIAKGSVCDDAHAYDRVEANAGVVAASDFSDFPIVFQQITGNVGPVGTVKTITVKQGDRSDDIDINHEGTINW